MTVLVLFSLGSSNAFAQVDQSITLTTNKNSYLPGDTVQLIGTVTGQPSAGVALQVKDSDGTLVLIRTVPVDQNGNFTIQFKIPITATSGNFSVVATARVDGFVVTQTKVFAAAVPEFGQMAGQVFGLSAIFMLSVFAILGKLKK